MQTRLAEPRELAAVEAIYRRATETASWLPPEQRSATDFAKAAEGERVVVCASGTGELLGFISVWEQGSFIHHLYVSPEHQQEGVGTRLVESLNEWLPLPWSLKCVVANTRALDFYRRRAFQVVSVHQDAIPPYALLRRGGN